MLDSVFLVGAGDVESSVAVGSIVILGAEGENEDERDLQDEQEGNVSPMIEKMFHGHAAGRLQSIEFSFPITTNQLVAIERG